MTPTHPHPPAHGHEHGHAHGHAHGRPGHGPAPEHDTGLAELLDLDARLGAPVLAAALDAAAAALGTDPRSAVDLAVDLGAGTGTGTLALAARFPGARVHALDASPAMLGRLGEAAAAARVADRVHPHLSDLDGDWPAVLPGAVDLAWAALSLHHVSDPGEVLRQVLGALRPGGVLVVVEMTGAGAHEPGDLGTGRAGLGARLTGALAAHGYPVTAEWTTALTAAGFAPVQRREVAFTASARTGDGARYLALQLARERARVAEDLPADDLAALDAAVAALQEGGSRLALTSARAVWTAVRPAADEPAADEPAADEPGARR
ncbi:methyltransferase [Kineococcus sp. T13]|uniref:class I SAM-dependent methyltransferase n=1 Tax=Kineococcus vitellinus TaxID=2696565 RepID=UPI0014133F63|nr:class I SAM-dependent methyltransferase [Kineococcus vitellinus]NAZ76904.1 methyltransferase [Kineococcus vitellinus]